MGLMQIAELAPLLVCPRCRAPLEKSATAYVCQAGHRFETVGQHPVLVDFDRSILLEEEVVASNAGSTIKRGSKGVKGALIGLMLPKNEVAAANARRLIDTLPKGGTLLVIGGADAGTGTEALYAELDVIGFDIYGTGLTQFVADAHRIPLADQSVDAVWIQAVLEHVLDPWQVVQETHRVLKPSGVVYAETPFLQPVHEGAFDFTRFTASGHRWMFKRFKEIDAGVAMGVGSQAVSGVEMLVRGLFRSVKAGVIAKAALFWVQKLERFVPRAHSQDAASAVFFYGRKSDVELSPRDMVSYYNGAFRRR